MKKITKLLVVLLGLFVVATSCTKEGPAGPAGEDGVNGTVNCVKCHDNSQEIFAKSNQWAASTHALGGNYERNGTDCAPCHTSQGFREVLTTGAMATATDISNPNPPNCYTCHNIHETYTESDWDLANTDAVEFWIDGTVSDQGTANMCIGCHQSRPLTIPDPTKPNDSTSITSPYWGPHHGPQGPMFAGVSGYEVGTGYTNSQHTNMVDNSCVDCHMADPYGTQAGGHVMSMTYMYHGHDAVWQEGCKSCHTDASALETKIEVTQLAIETLLDSLAGYLKAEGVMSTSGSPVPGKYTNKWAGAMYNYKFISEDRSNGVHNYAYSKKLLENTIADVK